MEAVKQQVYKKQTEVINLEVGKVMPHALELEEAVLGAMIIDKRGADDCLMIISTPDVFYDEKHRLIYTAIQQLYQESIGIDILTVSEKLRSSNTLDVAGGYVYIIDLTQKISSSAHIEFHSRILVQFYIKRQLIRDASVLMSQAFNEDKSSLELLEDFGKMLDSLSQQVLIGKREKSYKQGLQEVKERIEFLTHRGPEEITGISTGFANADRFTCGYQPQDLIIYAARPGMGKTSVMLSGVMANVKRGDAVGIISAEMSTYQLNARTVAMESNFHLRQITKSGFEKPEYFITLNAIIGRMESYGIYTDDTATPDIEHVRVQARQWHRKHNIKALYVDYLQLLKDVSVKGNREQEISSISRKLKGLAKELDIPVIALSQLSRAVETRGSSKRPLLSDLRESGAIEQDADAVVFIYRPGYYNIEPDDDITEKGGDSELIYAKYRGGAPNEAIALKWVGDKTKYYDPTEYRQYTEDNDARQYTEHNKPLPTPTAFEAFGPSIVSDNNDDTPF